MVDTYHHRLAAVLRELPVFPVGYPRQMGNWWKAAGVKLGDFDMVTAGLKKSEIERPVNTIPFLEIGDSDCS